MIAAQDGSSEGENVMSGAVFIRASREWERSHGRQFLRFATVVAFLSAAGAADAQPTGHNYVPINVASTNVVMVDTTSVTTSGTKTQAWFLFVFDPPKSVFVGLTRYLTTRDEYDCTAWTQHHLYENSYDDNGSLLNSQDLSISATKPVTPGTVGDAVLNALCKNQYRFGTSGAVDLGSAVKAAKSMMAATAAPPASK
jgi:hypothetical protein